MRPDGVYYAPQIKERMIFTPSKIAEIATPIANNGRSAAKAPSVESSASITVPTHPITVVIPLVTASNIFVFPFHKKYSFKKIY